jgi:hypothetical protein
MASKKTGSGKKPATRKPSTASANSEAKAPRNRKPPIERAEKLAGLLVKKHTALTKSSAKWHGEATPEQKAACIRIATNLGNTAEAVNQIVADIAFLHDSGFSPKSSAPGRKALSAGAHVQIKENRFDAVVHGTDNNFEVVQATEKYYILRGIENKKIQFSALRAWLDVVADADDVDAENSGELETE